MKHAAAAAAAAATAAADAGAAEPRRYHADVIGHMARHFGPVQELAILEVATVSGIAINVIRAREGKNPLILFTTGMSDRPQKVPAGQEEYRFTELMIRLPGDWPLEGEAFKEAEAFWPIRWLKDVAGYPGENDTWLGGPFAVISNDDPPRPLAPGTDLSCLLLLREPAPEGEVACGDGTKVLLYSVVPLYAEERDLEKAEGTGALLQRFGEKRVSTVVDVGRVNVAR